MAWRYCSATDTVTTWNVLGHLLENHKAPVLVDTEAHCLVYVFILQTKTNEWSGRVVSNRNEQLSSILNLLLLGSRALSDVQFNK